MTMAKIKVPAPNSARWTGHPDGVPFYFRLCNGVLDLGNVDREVLRKAEQVASLLEAEVDSFVD